MTRPWQPAGRVLLLGATGMLGRAWRALLDAGGIQHADPPHAQADFSRPQHLCSLVDAGISTVINCAAYTNVDGAEQEEGLAWRINGDAVGALADACRRSGALLVHYSTDYVFDGLANHPYPTDHPRNPVNAYGRSKARGEEAIEASGCRHLVMRTSWLYAPWAKNFVRTIAQLASQRPELKVVSDQRGRPTSSEHLADASLNLLRHHAEGFFHVTDGGDCTWFDFATEIVRLRSTDCQIRPCTTAEFPRPAPRPAYSVLDLTRTEAILGPMTPWKVNLADVIHRMEA
jgi:dTDP-4-dehydrorhamnose reductase